MSVSERTLRECPVCGDLGGFDCAGTMSAPHAMTDTVEVRYVRADACRGAVADAERWRARAVEAERQVEILRHENAQGEREIAALLAERGQ